MEELKRELDNYIYLLAGITLAIAVMAYDKAAGITLASALGGAILTKIKANGRQENGK